jgi:hypothetical protein
MKDKLKPSAKSLKEEKCKERIARWLYRRDKDDGKMVGTFRENGRFYKKEAKKILAIIWRCK